MSVRNINCSLERNGRLRLTMVLCGDGFSLQHLSFYLRFFQNYKYT